MTTDAGWIRDSSPAFPGEVAVWAAPDGLWPSDEVDAAA